MSQSGYLRNFKLGKPALSRDAGPAQHCPVPPSFSRLLRKNSCPNPPALKTQGPSQGTALPLWPKRWCVAIRATSMGAVSAVTGA